MPRGLQWQFGGSMTYMVQRLLVINLTIWIGGVLILQNLILDEPYIYKWFGLIPQRTVMEFWVWQPLTYMFVHSPSVFHVLFNMLVVWMFGSELEGIWGRRRFLAYYIGCGLGAAALYLMGAVIFFLIQGDPLILTVPVVGASGAVFGLMLAYGILFGERELYFMGLFPMKAKVFVLVIGAVEVLNLLTEGFSSGTANLAHLGGLLSGFGILKFWASQGRRGGRGSGGSTRGGQTRGRNLRLVVDNEPPKGEPKYWN